MRLAQLKKDPLAIMRREFWKRAPATARIEVLREVMHARWNAAKQADRLAGEAMKDYRAARAEFEREVCKGETKGRTR